MNKAEEVFERLKAGTPWGQAKKGVGGSTAYGGYNLFDAWVEPRVTQKQAEVNAEEDKVRKLREQVGGLDDEAKSKIAAVEMLSARQQALEKGCAELETKASLLGEQVGKMEEGLKTLDVRGITPDVVEAVAGTDAAGATELLARVKTDKEHKALETRVEELRGVERSLNEGNATLGGKRDGLRTEVASEGNALDEIKRKTVYWRESQLVVQDAFNRDYSSEMLTSLLRALKRFEIKGQPNQSIIRLIKGLEVEKSLEEQQSRLRQVDSELEETTKKLDVIKGTISAGVNTVIPAINTATSKAIGEVAAFRNKANAELEDLARKQHTSLAKLGADAESKLKSISQLVTAEAEVVDRRLNTIYGTLNLSFDIYQQEIKKWGVIQQEAGKHEAALRYGSLLQTLVTDPTQAVKLPPDLALLFANCLHIWIEIKLPKATTLPPPHINQREAVLPRYSTVQLRSIVDWIKVDLTERRLRGEI
jgi:hypothetical protein